MATKKLVKLKTLETKIMYTAFGLLEELVLIGHGDAGVKSMPDRLTSVAGQVVILQNKKSHHSCVLGWKVKKKGST